MSTSTKASIAVVLVVFGVAFADDDYFAPKKAVDRVERLLNPSQRRTVDAIEDNPTLTKQQIQQQLADQFASFGGNIQTAYNDALANATARMQYRAQQREAWMQSLSPQAQQLMQQEQQIRADMSLTFPTEKYQIRQLYANASPAVLAELRSGKKSWRKQAKGNGRPDRYSDSDSSSSDMY